MDILERYVAIDDKCAWPNLTPMPDGSIVAAIFGEPCHQLWEGSAECWISSDGGRLWSFLSVPVQHEPNRTRGDLAAGPDPRGGLRGPVQRPQVRPAPGGDARPAKNQGGEGQPGSGGLPFCGRGPNLDPGRGHQLSRERRQRGPVRGRGEAARKPPGGLLLFGRRTAAPRTKAATAPGSTSATTTGGPGGMPGSSAPAGTTKPTCWSWGKAGCSPPAARREPPRPRSSLRKTKGRPGPAAAR